MIDPVIEYANIQLEDGLGTVVIGGYVYRGDALPDLQDSYSFGDWSTQFGAPDGRLFVATPQEGDGLWPMREIPVANSGGERLEHFLLGFGQDHEGEVYVLVSENTAPTGNSGKVFRVAPVE